MACVDAPEHGVNQGLDHLSAKLCRDQWSYRSVAKFPAKIMAGRDHIESCSKESSEGEHSGFCQRSPLRWNPERKPLRHRSDFASSKDRSSRCSWGAKSVCASECRNKFERFRTTGEESISGKINGPSSNLRRSNLSATTWRLFNDGDLDGVVGVAESTMITPYMFSE
jgi:hypothetical protein